MKRHSAVAVQRMVLATAALLLASLAQPAAAMNTWSGSVRGEIVSNSTFTRFDASGQPIATDDYTDTLPYGVSLDMVSQCSRTGSPGEIVSRQVVHSGGGRTECNTQHVYRHYGGSYYGGSECSEDVSSGPCPFVGDDDDYVFEFLTIELLRQYFSLQGLASCSLAAEIGAPNCNSSSYVTTGSDGVGLVHTTLRMNATSDNCSAVSVPCVYEQNVTMVAAPALKVVTSFVLDTKQVQGTADGGHVELRSTGEIRANYKMGAPPPQACEVAQCSDRGGADAADGRVAYNDVDQDMAIHAMSASARAHTQKLMRTLYPVSSVGGGGH